MYLLKILPKLATYVGFTLALNGIDPVYGAIASWEDIQTKKDLESVFLKLQLKFSALNFGLCYNLVEDHWEVSRDNAFRCLKPVIFPVDTTQLEETDINRIQDFEGAKQSWDSFYFAMRSCGYCIARTGNSRNNHLVLLPGDNPEILFTREAQAVLLQAKDDKERNRTISSIWIFLQQYLLSHGWKFVLGSNPIALVECPSEGDIRARDVPPVLYNLYWLVKEWINDPIFRSAILYTWQGFLEEIGFFINWHDGFGTWIIYDRDQGKQAAWRIFDPTATPVDP